MFPGSLYLLKSKTDLKINIRYEGPPQEGQRGYHQMKKVEKVIMFRDRRDQRLRAWNSKKGKKRLILMGGKFRKNDDKEGTSWPSTLINYLSAFLLSRHGGKLRNHSRRNIQL